jgi:hypothetical protein
MKMKIIMKMKEIYQCQYNEKWRRNNDNNQNNINNENNVEIIMKIMKENNQ